jgi:hypothetical protein
VEAHLKKLKLKQNTQIILFEKYWQQQQIFNLFIQSIQFVCITSRLSPMFPTPFFRCYSCDDDLSEINISLQNDVDDQFISQNEINLELQPLFTDFFLRFTLSI